MKQKKKKTNDKRRYDGDIKLDDLGLEPPKIYRESQNRVIENNNRERNSSTRRTQKGNQPKSRNEQRQKQNKKRHKKNKLRKVLIWFLLVALLVSVVIVLSLTVFFKIENITVKGNERYSQEEIISLCTINKEENLFLADTGNAKKMLEINLPYIYNVEIKRKLPATIELTVTEGEAAYCIRNYDKSYILLDDNLKVLELSSKKKKGIEIKKLGLDIKVVEGTKLELEDQKLSECIDKLVNVVNNTKSEKITAIYSKSLVDNYIVYDNRITFKLGNCDNLESKLYQALASCKELEITDPNAKGTMTVTGGKQIYFTEK